MKVNLLKSYRRKIAETVAQAPVNKEEKTRLEHYSIFLSFGIPAMILFGSLNFINANYVIALFVLIACVGLFVGWIALKHIKNSRIVYRMNAVIYCSLLLYSLFLGGNSGSRILWMYTIPLIVFFLFGKKEGAIWSLAIVVTAVLLLFNVLGIETRFGYPTAFKIRFLTSYLIVTGVTYWFEYFREYYRKKLEIENEKLEKALNEVKTLGGFIPICSSCKNIRDDQGYWNRVEEYLNTHSEAHFSHSICPDCVKKLYPDLAEGFENEFEKIKRRD